ncbi:hypothetical protein PTTG_05993 [Puccinia triticina 1-1 BBBD Race 1]|uniref:Uncharacterized protein n=2 Tax=Puccinia triticina TaxID=208348 RepID=A0A180GAT1_PUCT1|nr:uncharacterized protein PtA15_3A646 [Puccinia triticina]OAV89442.1 hypothetical protein PTTG_05993 [Puccinia triticina 1-1 BBBD Race 1]WAQ83277.1 hypothetical protein PtA15_3A646 [Puccinia triticina]WAR54125.1 hypothetical protein PtB15_3B637 [Puccinia triticina]
MDGMEETPGDAETVERVQWTEEILSVIGVLQELAHKHSLEPDHLSPGERDPSLTIEHMGGKLETWETLHSILLPSIRGQLTLLLTSLDLIDPKRNPKSVTEPTLEILSDLDITLGGIVSAVVSLTRKPPLPDENRDQGLEKVKVFRCSYLNENIQLLVVRFIYHRLFLDLIPSFIRWCARANIHIQDDSLVQEGSALRAQIQLIISYCNGIITRTINWGKRSDWVNIHRSWIEAHGILGEALEAFTWRTNLTTQGTPEAGPNENNETTPTTELIGKVAESAIPLVKLARILSKKTSENLLKKRISTLDTTLELNSETIKQLHETPDSMLRLYYLSSLSCFPDRSGRVIPVDQQNSIRSVIQNLPRDMESTLTVLNSCLIPLLAKIKHDPPDSQWAAFLLDLKQSWDKASERLIAVLVPFQLERTATAVE